MANPRTIGWIGLGHAGYPMASNLPRAGYNLVVRDADPETEQRFVKEFSNSKVAARAGPSALEDCDVIVTMLPHGKIVHEVLLGDNGIASSLKDNTIIIDTSSSSPFDTRALGTALEDLNPTLTLIDSPITQEQLHAIGTGGATLMLGCDSAATLERAMPVIKSMSKYQFHMGSLGSGHIMKTLNNYVSVGSILALCDALVVGAKHHLNPQTIIDVLNVGTGRNFSSAYSMQDMSVPGTSGYGLDLLLKDVRIAKEVIQSARFESGLPDLAIERLEEAVKLTGGPGSGADHTDCVRAWEKSAGVIVRARDGSAANGGAK
jgi:3-hydroxyisobutyrate dehydrogenase-like beta-hydroxyacid dehydrogenase